MAKRKMLPIEYTTKDYEGFKQMMLEQIPVIAPEWTDTSDGDFGIILMELLCYGLDILSFYQDKAVNESFLPTARTRKSVINICRLLGYELKQQQPYTHPLIFKKIQEFKSQPITIHAGTLVGTDPSLGTPVPFEVDTTIVIPAGAIGDEKDSHGNYLYATSCTQGETMVDDLGSGTGEPLQKIKLNYEDALIDSIKVWTEENGIVRDWERVEDFLDSKETDRHFIAHLDENNNVFLEFGDGMSGLRPRKFIPIFASYRVGGGKVGDVGKGAINTFIGEEVLGIDEITNPDSAIKIGCDPESIEHAKSLAPRMFKSNWRAVTIGDFEILSMGYQGVEKAKCIETFNEQGEVILYIASSDHKPTSEQFKKELMEFLNERKMVNTKITIKDAQYKSFDVDLKITTYQDYVNEDVKAILETFLAKILDPKNFGFGEELKLAYIIKELMMREEVMDIQFNTPKSNIEVESTEVLKINSIKVTVEGGMK